MATADPSESPVPVEATESNSTPSGQDTIKDEQWRAMKRVIDTIYEYRQPGYVAPGVSLNKPIDLFQWP